MAYSNSYMFLGIGLFVFLSSQALANHVASVPLNYGEALDDQKVDLEHVKAQKREDALDLNEQMAEEYVNAQKIGKALYEEKALENMIAQ
ncbi:hypothetical protein P8452_46013 [Trifolium repens]|nr:hypothetical protein P8452_46013 [Trifolium repens]